MSELPQAPSTVSNEEGGTRTSRPSAGLVLVVAVAVVGLGIFGYWKFIYYPTTPQYAIDRFLEAVQRKDYDRVYDMVQVPASVKVFLRNGRDLKALVDQNKNLVPQVTEHHFLNSTETDGTAIVNTSVTSTQAGKQSTSVLPFKLVKDHGVWFIDGHWVQAQIVRGGFAGLFVGGQ